MKNKEMDFVEGLTPFKMEKETADTAGASNVKAPTPTTRERERALDEDDENT
jgi:hypothetical protein